MFSHLTRPNILCFTLLLATCGAGNSADNLSAKESKIATSTQDPSKGRSATAQIRTSAILISPFGKVAKKEATTTTSMTTESVATSSTAPPPINVSLSSTITTSSALPDIKIENTGSADQSYVPVTFGQVFAPGDVPASNTLTGKLSDGSVVPFQVNAKATHPDGSLRHGIISTILPRLAVGQTQTIGLVKTTLTSSSQPAATPLGLINSGFSANVSINLGGQIYSASADSLLKSGKYMAWLAGPIANEWLASAPLKTSAGVAHPHLTARFAIRSFTGLNKARVDVTIENNWAYEPGPQNFTYDAQVGIGGKTVYSKSALTHFHHARWRKTFWWGVAPQVHIKHNTAYLIASKAVPNYDQTVVISSAALTLLKTGFAGVKVEPMGPGIAAPYMPGPGGRPDIGLLPGWAATYLLSMDKDSKNATMGMGDLAGSWSVHYRDRNTDRPVSLLDHPYMTILGSPGDTYNPATKIREAFPICGGSCINTNVADSDHEPSFNYLPYIVTGDYFHLEELQFWAMWNIFQSNPGYRENVKALFHRTQVRAQAWILRTLADATYITPDSDPLKAQFGNFLANNLDWYNNTYTNNLNANKLGALTEDGAIAYGAKIGIAPWMDDFFTSAVGHVVEMGYSKAKPLLLWKSKFPISRMNDPSFCWIVGAIYSLNIRDSEFSPIYSTIGEAYRASKPPSFTSLACAGTEMAINLSLKVNEMTGYSSSNTGYPSNMQPALAYSADSNSINGANAWKIFMGRSVKPNYSMSPQFAIIPR